MDIEFHYYQTYLIAARAGFVPHDAYVIAHSAQGVDDNHIPVQINNMDGSIYKNQISQTMDIVRPHEDLLIYPIFHFIPGDKHAKSAQRADGCIDAWVTTPNSALANQMIDAALASNDFYRIGVSAHGYVDTWAHQNFLGRRDRFNEFSHNPLNLLNDVMAVGHAHAGHWPDWPGLVWNDGRLQNPTVVNRDRFLDAAAHLFEKFARHINPVISDARVALESQALLTDLDHDIGPVDNSNAEVQARISRYMARSLQAPYGATAIPAYFDGQWFSDAIKEDHDTVEADAKGTTVSSWWSDLEAFTGDYFADRHRQQVNWKDPAGFASTDWYRFNEAVKAHLAECKAMLIEQQLLPATA